MRRHSVAVIGAVTVAMTAGATPSAWAQPSDRQYVSTAGNVRCVISADGAACERMGIEGFRIASATRYGGSGRVASVDPGGNFSWAEAGIGGPTDWSPEFALGKVTPYRLHGWTVLLAPDGTRLTNDDTTHGMLISLDGATVTPY
jgi:hypothetical protein